MIEVLTGLGFFVCVVVGAYLVILILWRGTRYFYARRFMRGVYHRWSPQPKDYPLDNFDFVNGAFTRWKDRQQTHCNNDWAARAEAEIRARRRKDDV